jgi:glycosyltransferase involved in cell wall biosynthesis
MKIAVYSICKNEAPHVERFLNSCAGADLVVVADTGSTDGTQNEFTKRQAGPTPIALHQISLSPWRFDTARNIALSLVPADVDVCIRLDIDEVLDPGWRPALEDAWIEGTTRLWYWFNHAPGYRFRLNNIHARHGYHWRGLDHEALYDATGLSKPRTADDRLSITHHQDHTKDRTGILPRLIAQVQEDERARTLYYLGREYYYYRRNREATRHISVLSRKEGRHLGSAERMDVMSMIAESYERLYGQHRRRHSVVASCNRRVFNDSGTAIWASRLLRAGGQKELAARARTHAPAAQDAEPTG